MRFTLSLFAIVLFVTACRPYKDSPDETMQKLLTGTWTFEAKYGGVSTSEETVTVAPDGRYALTINSPTRTNGPRTVNLEGTFRVKDGFLVDIKTKDSQTNALVPYTNRSRIIRIDERELKLEFEHLPGIGYPTNEVTYLKQTN